jgi:hypothetical protein
MRPDQIETGRVYFHGNKHRMVVGIYHPIPGIDSDSFVEYRVRGDLRVKRMWLKDFAGWARPIPAEKPDGETK